MAQIQPLNNDTIHEPINNDLTSGIHHDNPSSVKQKKCKPVMICSSCFVLAALIVIVVTVAVVVPLNLNRSQPTMTESDTTNALETSNALGITTALETASALETATAQETTRSSETTQAPTETCKCLFNKNISGLVSIKIISESPLYVFYSAS